MALAELGAELGVRAGRARFVRGTASSPICVSTMSAPSSRASTPSPLSRGSRSRSPDVSTPSPPHPASPSTSSRTRAVPIYSALAATANTPPRPPKMYTIHPFFIRRAAPAPHQPRCVAAYTSTSESGSSLSELSFSEPSFSDPSLDEADFSVGSLSPCSPLDSGQRPPQSPIPSRAMPAPRVPSARAMGAEDATARRAHRFAAAVKVRKARAAPVVSPSADRVADAIARLNLSADSTWVRDKAADVFTDAQAAEEVEEVRKIETVEAVKTVESAKTAETVKAVETAKTVETANMTETTKTTGTAKGPGARPRRRTRPPVEPSELPYFSVTRPLTGHFDRPPNVVYTRNVDEADDLVSCLRGPLGFDLEWPPPGIGPVMVRQNKDGSVKHYRAGKWDPLAKRYVWPQGRTAVVQVADARTVVVYHLPMDGVIGPGLKAVLNDPMRIKLGVNIGMDARKMYRDELIENTCGLLDLSHVAHLVDPDVWTRSGRLIALARLTKHYLGVPLDKSEGIREGAWSHDLNVEQIEYAANDAYVGVLIYNAMVRRAAERGLTSELEALEQQISIPQFRSPAFKLAENTRGHPAVVAAARAGAKPRQRLALALFIAGGSVSDLATALQISTRTVQGYVAEAALLIPPDEYEGYGELAVRLCEAFPTDSYPAVQHVEFFSRLRRIASAADDEERVPVHQVHEYEWGPDY